MKTESLYVGLDVEEHEHDPWETSTVLCGIAAQATGVFAIPRWPTVLEPGVATVTIGGTLFVYTQPTPQWLTIYPSTKPEPSLDILEDLDIPFKPKKRWRAEGAVVKRSRAEFETAFAGDLVDEANTK